MNQLLLRHLSSEGHINYADINNKTVEQRNIDSGFANQYPDELESDLCAQIESQFEIILKDKILNQRYKISLTRDDILIIKKFLLISRIRTSHLGDKTQLLPVNHFYSYINKILESDSLEEINIICNNDIENFPLWIAAKSIFSSYICFFSSVKTDEDFIMNDIGYACNYYNTINKWQFMITQYEINQDLRLLSIAELARNNDEYTIFPISKDLAIVCMNLFYKFFDRQSELYGILKLYGYRIDELIGFGDVTTIAAPNIRRKRKFENIYEYDIKHLKKDEVIFQNALILNEADKYIMFDSSSSIRDSILKYLEDGSRCDYSFLI